jgi:hypothetical protein
LAQLLIGAITPQQVKTDELSSSLDQHVDRHFASTAVNADRGARVFGGIKNYPKAGTGAGTLYWAVGRQPTRRANRTGKHGG